MSHDTGSSSLVRLSIVAERVANAAHVDEGIQAVVQAARDLFAAQTVAVLLLDPQGENLRVRASRGLSPAYAASFSRPLGHGVAAEVALAGMALVLPDPSIDQDAYKDLKLEQDFASAMAVQLSAGHKPLGILYCDHREAGRFERGDVQLLGCLGMLAALSIEKQDLLETVSRLAVTDTATGLYTYNHFYNRLADDVARSLRYGGALGLLVFEIAHLAQVEELYGRMAAEDELRCLAEIVRENTRGVDYAGRYSADQIIVALVRTDATGVETIAARIGGLVGEAPVTYTPPSGPRRGPAAEGKRGVKTLKVDVYIAGAVAPEHGRNMADLAASLRNAMQRARSLGAGSLAMAGR